MASFDNVPDCIIISFLFRLSVRMLCVLKCVSRRCARVISSLEFATMRFNQRKAAFLVRAEQHLQEGSTEIFLVEGNDFARFTGNLPLGCQLGLPRTQLYVVNSCNGMICVRSSDYPNMICNPITRDFIIVPEVRRHLDLATTCSGFGVSAGSNTYKVITMLMAPRMQGRVLLADVHTLGSHTWRAVDPFHNAFSLSSPTYCKGFIYWLGFSYVSERGQVRYVFPFEIETEIFHFPIALPREAENVIHPTSLGVIGERLMLCSSGSERVNVWTMHPDAPDQVWDLLMSFPEADDDRGPAAYIPMMIVNNGALLYVPSKRNAFLSTVEGGNERQQFSYPGFGRGIEAISHLESLIPMEIELGGQADGLRVHHY